MKTKLSVQRLIKELNKGVSVSTLRITYGTDAYKYRKLLKRTYSFEKIIKNPKPLPIDMDKAIQTLIETQSISKTMVLLNYTILGSKKHLADKGWKIKVSWELIKKH